MFNENQVSVKEHRAKIVVDSDSAAILKELCEMTGEEAYDKYGLKFAEAETYTAQFDDGREVDVKLCISDEENTNWCEAVLFDHGCEIACSEVEEEFFGEWSFEVDDDDDGLIHRYVVDVVEENKEGVAA